MSNLPISSFSSILHNQKQKYQNPTQSRRSNSLSLWSNCVHYKSYSVQSFMSCNFMPCNFDVPSFYVNPARHQFTVFTTARPQIRGSVHCALWLIAGTYYWGMARLSWPGWLVTYQDGLPASATLATLIRPSDYSHGFGLGVEPSELLYVQLPVAVAVELPQQHDDLAGREVEWRTLQDRRCLVQSYEPVTVLVEFLELRHQLDFSAHALRPHCYCELCV